MTAQIYLTIKQLENMLAKAKTLKPGELIGDIVTPKLLIQFMFDDTKE